MVPALRALRQAGAGAAAAGRHEPGAGSAAPRSSPLRRGCRSTPRPGSPVRAGSAALTAARAIGEKPGLLPDDAPALLQEVRVPVCLHRDELVVPGLVGRALAGSPESRAPIGRRPPTVVPAGSTRQSLLVRLRRSQLRRQRAAVLQRPAPPAASAPRSCGGHAHRAHRFGVGFCISSICRRRPCPSAPAARPTSARSSFPHSSAISRVRRRWRRCACARPRRGRRSPRRAARAGSRRAAPPPAASFSCAWPTATSPSTTRAPVAASTLRSSACAHTAPNAPVLAPTTATGMLRSDVGRERARRPVEGVLELARDRRVVLGRREQHGVRPGERRAQRGDRRRGRLDVVVLVVGGHVPQAVPQLELHPGGQELRRAAQEQRVVGVRPQAARDAEHLHRDRYSFTR